MIEDKTIFSLAGLYDNFIDKDGKRYDSFTIITTAANDDMKGRNNLNEDRMETKGSGKPHP